MKTMFSKRLTPLTLIAFAAVAVPVHCSAFKSINKKDCIVALDGSCVDSIDFTGSSKDFNTLPNDDLLAFNTLPTDPIIEPLTFLDSDTTNFGGIPGTEDLGDTSSLFFDDGGLGGFLISAGTAACTCPRDIQSSKVRNFVPFSPSRNRYQWLTLHQGCLYAQPDGDVSKSTLKHESLTG